MFSKQQVFSLPPTVRMTSYLVYHFPAVGFLSISEQDMENYIHDLLAAGIIRPSSSPSGARFFFVGKTDGTHWPCIDSWKLNNITVRNKYSLLLMNSSFIPFREATIFSTLDLHNAYHLMPIWVVEDCRQHSSEYAGFIALFMPFIHAAPIKQIPKTRIWPINAFLKLFYIVFKKFLVSQLTLIPELKRHDSIPYFLHNVNFKFVLFFLFYRKAFSHLTGQILWWRRKMSFPCWKDQQPWLYHCSVSTSYNVTFTSSLRLLCSGSPVAIKKQTLPAYCGSTKEWTELNFGQNSRHIQILLKKFQIISLICNYYIAY